MTKPSILLAEKVLMEYLGLDNKYPAKLVKINCFDIVAMIAIGIELAVEKPELLEAKE